MQQRNAEVCLEWLPTVSAPSSIACDPIITKNDTFFVTATCYGQIKQCCTHFSGGIWVTELQPPIGKIMEIAEKELMVNKDAK